LTTYSRIFCEAQKLYATGDQYRTAADLVQQAVCQFFQSGVRITPSHLSQINSLSDCRILPVGMDLGFIKRMHKGAMSASPPTSTVDLHERAVLPAVNVMEFLLPFSLQEDLLREVTDEEFFIALSIATGHHCGESWMWQVSFYKPSTGELFYPAFKFHSDKIIKIGCVYQCLESYIDKCRPQWRLSNVPPAQLIWSSQAQMAASIAKTLQHYLPAAPPGAEEWTHRLLRRTYASVLNAVKAPVDLIKRQLLHESIDAVDNYVVIYGDQDVSDLQELFSFSGPLSFMPDDCGAFMKPSEPRSFIPKAKRKCHK
jgi:hypothetical protein